MKRRCPYCAENIDHLAATCPECGKAVKTKQGDSVEDEQHGLTSRAAYEKKMIPLWLFVLIVGIFVLGIVLLFV